MRLNILITVLCLFFISSMMAQKKNDLKRDTTNRKTVTFGGGARDKKPKEKKQPKENKESKLQFNDPVVKEKADRIPKDTTEKGKSKWKILFAFDARTSFIRYNGLKTAKIFGLKLGATYNKKHRFGIGLYGLQSQKTPIRSYVGSVAVQDSISGEVTHFNDIVHDVEFSYSTFFYEYVFYDKRRWEFSVPFHIGSGTATVTQRQRTPEGAAVAGTDTLLGIVKPGVLGLSVGGHYKVMPWIGIGGGIGYRYMMTGDKDVRKALNAPLFIIKVKVFFGDAYRGLFKRKKGYAIYYKNCEPCTEGWEE